MKTPMAILLGCLFTGYGAFADSGYTKKTHLKTSEEKPKSLSKSIHKAVNEIGRSFDELDKKHFFNQHFEGNTEFRKTGIYLFRNYRGMKDKNIGEQKV